MKKKKVLAGILGVVMVAGVATSFAYFTGKNDGIGNGANGKLQKIQITNGNVVVKAEVENNGASDFQWSYDVAKHSGATVEKDASPDINAVNKTPDSNGIERAVIGSPVTTPVQFTRPGDALVLGVPGKNGEESGLRLINESNLTVKMQLVVKNDAAAKAELDKLTAAGWELYVNDAKVDLTSESAVDLGVVAKGGEKNVDVRFELPLLTGNTKQDKSTASTADAGFDLNSIVELQATQENNPGWSEDGE
ncbi:hypothetical protein CM240_0111 [Clostridium bornimense]|uniref:Secreted protein n=1 Tax=Clostridium bornimense TaxID=1216932 RepID=W6SCD7_9CLOT|nr:hypothetical protein [Clostridium bornimense]CDM67290.1 hypothetical protein CM240_0111 [Clostridium bornimense]